MTTKTITPHCQCGALYGQLCESDEPATVSVSYVRPQDVATCRRVGSDLGMRTMIVCCPTCAQNVIRDYAELGARVDEPVELRHVLGDLAAVCEREARDKGWTGQGYDPTREDCRWIVEHILKQFGRAPTREEWGNVGLGWVGDEHLMDEMTPDEATDAAHDWATLVATMDDDLREQVHSELAPCSALAFAARYAELHLGRHGTKWPEPGMPAIPGLLQPMVAEAEIARRMGNVVSMYYAGRKYAGREEFLKEIAPYVKDGSRL